MNDNNKKYIHVYNVADCWGRELVQLVKALGW